MDGAIDFAAVPAILADSDRGVGRAAEIFGDPGGQFAFDPGSEGLADIHSPTGDLYAHKRTSLGKGRGGA